MFERMKERRRIFKEEYDKTLSELKTEKQKVEAERLKEKARFAAKKRLGLLSEEELKQMRIEKQKRWEERQKRMDKMLSDLNGG